MGIEPAPARQAMHSTHKARPFRPRRHRMQRRPRADSLNVDGTPLPDQADGPRPAIERTSVRGRLPLPDAQPSQRLVEAPPHIRIRLIDRHIDESALIPLAVPQHGPNQRTDRQHRPDHGLGIVHRVVGPRIRIRRVDKSKFDAEAQIIIGILNDAWSDNWGFVPFTDREIEYAGKKLKPLVFNDLIRIAEVEGVPAAFLMAIPDMNELLIKFGGKLLPFNWAKLLWWLRAPHAQTMRVPLMGVLKKYQSSRVASQLAMMLIEHIRRDAVSKFGATRGDFGWVLSSNGPMRSVGEAVGGKINKVYRVYEKAL